MLSVRISIRGGDHGDPDKTSDPFIQILSKAIESTTENVNDVITAAEGYTRRAWCAGGTGRGCWHHSIRPNRVRGAVQALYDGSEGRGLSRAVVVVDACRPFLTTPNLLLFVVRYLCLRVTEPHQSGIRNLRCESVAEMFCC